MSFDEDGSSSPTFAATIISPAPTISPSVNVSTAVINITESFIEAEKKEEEHEFDAAAAFTLNLTIICCLLLAYAVKRFRIYSLPESAGALLVGVLIGGMARLTTDRLELFEFSPEVFFFFLLPPIIFEAGYSLDRKGFFENIGAITLYAMFGTMISTFAVGFICFYAAKIGLVSNIDDESPMEALLFGSLISAVDPVATLSIMGNEELNVDPLLYSLVFGESVLNDAIAICLFKTFFQFYNPEAPTSDVSIVAIILNFVTVSGLSILVGVGLGMGASYLYRHTDLKRYPNLETSLLLCFCYLCYATAETVQLSGIMALFFQGLVLSHYNAYNLSPRAHVASEQIFSTFATLTETIVFVYMGMGVFTGGFKTFDLAFSILAFVACLIGRALNIFPLSWLANLCRQRSKISGKMQMVLWFAGLRGAIAFALSENMPGPHKDVYATATLTICIVTTVFCGGCTEKMLTVFGMREEPTPQLDSKEDTDGEQLNLRSLSYQPPAPNRRESVFGERQRRIQEGIKGAWNRFDDVYLKPMFGGDVPPNANGRVERQGSKDHDSDHEYSESQWADERSWSSNNGFEMSTTSRVNGSVQRNPSSRHGSEDEEMVSLTSRQNR